MVAELEAEGAAPALERRDAAVMFVDLRSFSRFSEGVEPMEVASPVSSGRRNGWMESGCDGGSAAFGWGPAG